MGQVLLRANAVLMHYNGYEDQFDVWLDLTDEEQRRRLSQPLAATAGFGRGSDYPGEPVERLRSVPPGLRRLLQVRCYRFSCS